MVCQMLPSTSEGIQNWGQEGQGAKNCGWQSSSNDACQILSPSFQDCLPIPILPFLCCCKHIITARCTYFSNLLSPLLFCPLLAWSCLSPPQPFSYLLQQEAAKDRNMATSFSNVPKMASSGKNPVYILAMCFFWHCTQNGPEWLPIEHSANYWWPFWDSETLGISYPFIILLFSCGS